MPNVLPIGLLNHNLTNHNFITRTNQPNEFATALQNAQDKEKAKARLKEVSYELEAIFINMLLKLKSKKREVL